jgi:serine/threonine protein kinase
MVVHPLPPEDDTLRAFLLGVLPPERVEVVRERLEADRAHASRLGRLAAGDAITDAVSSSTAELPTASAAVERIVRGVAESLRTPAPHGADVDPGGDGTIPQLCPPTDDSLPGWVPARLGGYRVVRELGHGGMGYVFEAEDERLGRRVAIKVLAPDLAHRPGVAARFLREARAAAAVEHDNVVPILHVGEDAGVPYMVMPLLRGESLADRLKRGGTVPVAEVVRVGRDAAAGLAAAHARGLVHRDIKPANVWLDAADGRARVLDFGLARLGDGADALTEAGALLGTPAYMAPEQVDGLPATPRSDLFSLGALLYECVTGRRAFTGPTVTAVLKSVGTHEPTPPAQVDPRVPPALSALIVRLLAKDPAARPADAGEVVAALAAVAAGDQRPTSSFHDLESPPVRATPRWLWFIAGVRAELADSRGFAVVVPDEAAEPSLHRTFPGWKCTAAAEEVARGV